MSIFALPRAWRTGMPPSKTEGLKGGTPMAITTAITIPDSKLAHEVTEMVRDTESELLFNHSTRVYLWAALTGKRKGLKFDPELLYTGAMFHDLGLTERYRG